MLTLKGIYNDGIIELFQKPDIKQPIEVVVVFPELEKKEIKKIRGLFKNSSIDYKEISNDLSVLSKNSEEHIIKELN